jgi:hypothetical protein
MKLGCQKRREMSRVAERLLGFNEVLLGSCSHLPYVQAKFRFTCRDRAITSLVSVEYSA